MKILSIFNPLLMIFGRKIVRSYLGHWSCHPVTGKSVRRRIPVGWRLARRGEWEGLADDATELDRFMAREAAE